MKILVGYSYFDYPVDIRQWNEAWLARLRAAGLDVTGTCLTLNPPAGRLAWAELDERWRRRDRELLSFYEELARQVEGYDVLVNYNGINLHPEFVRQLPTFNVFGCFDDPESSADLSQPVAAAYDLCMVGNIAELAAYRRWGAKAVRFLPIGFRPDDFDPALTRQQILEGRRDVDLTLLCERVSPWRVERLDRLVAAFPDGTYYGPGWPKGFLPEDQRVPLLQRTRIGINLHNSTGPINFRTFYLPANGVLQICDNKKHLAEIFELNREVVGFDSIEEAIELVRYYRAHDEERRHIAAAGWERALRDYNEVAAFRRLIQAVAEVQSERAAPSNLESAVTLASPAPARPVAPAAPAAVASVPAAPKPRAAEVGTIFLHTDSLYAPDQWFHRFEHLLENEYHLPYVLVDLLGDDRLQILSRSHEADALIGRFGHIPDDLQLIRPIFDQLWRAFGGRVFPSRSQYFYYDDKARQAELFRKMKYPTPKTGWVASPEELEALLRQAGLSFPLVVKQAAGAGSANVHLARNLGEVSFPCLVQEFCPGNDRDWRLNVIGNRVMGFARLNRENDFRASGSGRLVYPEELDPALVQLAHRISLENGFPSMAYDFIRRGQEWVVVECSYAYVDAAVRDCQFYYQVDTGARVDKRGVYPQDFILADFLHEHYGLEPRPALSGKGKPAVSPPVADPAPASAPVPSGAQRVAGPKPRILLVADVPNWVFEHHARTLHQYLGNEFDFTLGFQGQKFSEADYDLIYPLEWNLIPRTQIQTPAKYVTGIRSHTSWQDEDFLGFTDFLASQFQRVHVVSKRLERMFAPFLPNLTRLTHGVDAEFFTPAPPANPSPRGRLRLGWAGNRMNPTKGFQQFIAPLGNLPGIELSFCGFMDQNLNREQVRRFYDSVDAYVCASQQEGNNNSLLEAAAMQRAIITTDNGAVPEYLRPEESALIVEREVPDFICAAIRLRDDPALRKRLGMAAREAVVRAFPWPVMAQQYAAFFRQALAQGDPAGAAKTGGNGRRQAWLAGANGAVGAKAARAFSFLDYLGRGTLIEGQRTQLEIRRAGIKGVSDSSIYLHPPARLRFDVPTAAAGRITSAVAIQPEAWDKPNAGGCEFCLHVDGKETFRKIINPTREAADRCWHEVQIDVPATASSGHEVILSTRAVGSPPDFRWALWRRPVFRW